MSEILLELPMDVPPKDPIPFVEFIKTTRLIKQEETKNDDREDQS